MGNCEINQVLAWPEAAIPDAAGFLEQINTVPGTLVSAIVWQMLFSLSQSAETIRSGLLLSSGNRSLNVAPQGSVSPRAGCSHLEWMELDCCDNYSEHHVGPLHRRHYSYWTWWSRSSTDALLKHVYASMWEIKPTKSQKPDPQRYFEVVWTMWGIQWVGTTHYSKRGMAFGGAIQIL